MTTPYIESSFISRVTIVINIREAKKPRGRPRAFDRSEALKAATLTFWRLGYEGTSIADLTAAIGITPQSLYAAFRSKAELYRESLAFYRSELGSMAAPSPFEVPDVIEAFRLFLENSAREFTRPGMPHGCMISTATLTCAVENQEIADHVASLRDNALQRVRDRLARGVADGQLSSETDVEALARFLGAIIQGMSVQARDGADEAELLAIAGLALDQFRRHAIPLSNLHR
jgi:AcrR family transcriptional regulator